MAEGGAGPAGAAAFAAQGRADRRPARSQKRSPTISSLLAHNAAAWAGSTA